MKERPILFSAPMVLALLAGTKTQTRRVLSTQPLDVLPFKGSDKERLWVGLMHRGETVEQNRGNAFRCKHGEPGDRLWVRETWGLHSPGDPTDWYRRSLKNLRGRYLWELAYRADWQVDDGSPFWRPSIFLKRKESRITLEVTGVRVERLQDISEADALAEGLESYDDDGVRYWGPLNKGHFDPRRAYFQLWDAINGSGAAAKNPWVWCIDFKRAQP